MPDDQFELMRNILAAPSPVGLEGAMVHGVLKPHMDSFLPPGWAFHTFKGSAGAVWDSAPGDDKKLKVMVMGHADKIRMQVRHISDDGKIWINSDSFLPMTLIGNKVTLYSSARKLAPEEPYRYLQGTVEAIGAIHFASAETRSGKKGISPEELYLELGLHGKDRKSQVTSLGIRPGDPILMDRPIQRCFAPDTFSGAYLDNGLGCFVAVELARLVVEHGADILDHVRLLCAVSSHEEIGRFGSRVLAADLAPDVLIAVDVVHDYEAAPNRSSFRDCQLKMGDGMTLCTGSISSDILNNIIETAAQSAEIPMQRDVRGRDTGNDAMAAFFANIDCAATSVGFPIRNMHTTSELAHTGDVLSCLHALYATLQRMAIERITSDYFKLNHPRLDHAESFSFKNHEAENIST